MPRFIAMRAAPPKDPIKKIVSSPSFRCLFNSTTKSHYTSSINADSMVTPPVLIYQRYAAVIFATFKSMIKDVLLNIYTAAYQKDRQCQGEPLHA
jgi:hypothetical protein